MMRTTRKPAHPAHPGYTGVSDARWRNVRDGNEQYVNDNDDYENDDHDSDKLIRTIKNETIDKRPLLHHP